MDNENKNRHPLLRILLLDIGVAGTSIFGALGVIAIAFIALNYFNLLSLSELYPKYLSLLPHRQTSLPRQPASQRGEQSTQTITKPINIQPNISPAPSISLEKTAQRLFSAFVSKNLNPIIVTLSNTYPVVPNTFEKNTFDSAWTVENSTVSAHFELSSDYKSLPYLNISIMTPQNTTPSAEFSAKIASQFFSISPQDVWKCKPVNGKISCENFWQEKDGIKRGIDIVGPIIVTNNQKVIGISLCEIHRDSLFYQSISCSH